MSTVKMSKVVEKMNLKNLTPDVDHTDKQVKLPDINRPALQLSGFFNHFCFRACSNYRVCRIFLFEDS